jgi:hypothetical protein
VDERPRGRGTGGRSAKPSRQLKSQTGHIALARSHPQFPIATTHFSYLSSASPLGLGPSPSCSSSFPEPASSIYSFSKLKKIIFLFLSFFRKSCLFHILLSIAPMAKYYIRYLIRKMHQTQIYHPCSCLSHCLVVYWSFPHHLNN